MAKTKLVSEAISRAGYLLHDVANTRWGETELLGWANDGQRAIIALDPAANTVRTTLSLSAGYVQTNPSACLRLLAVPFNTNGPVITRIVDIGALYLDDPDWTTATGVTDVEHVVFNEYEKNFITYPNLSGAAGSVDIVYAAYPTELTATSDTIDLEDEFFIALVNYLVYRALDKDSDNTVQPDISASKYAAFIGSLPNPNNLPTPDNQ